MNYSIIINESFVEISIFFIFLYIVDNIISTLDKIRKIYKSYLFNFYNDNVISITYISINILKIQIHTYSLEIDICIVFDWHLTIHNSKLSQEIVKRAKFIKVRIQVWSAMRTFFETSSLLSLISNFRFERARWEHDLRKSNTYLNTLVIYTVCSLIFEYNDYLITCWIIGKNINRD